MTISIKTFAKCLLAFYNIIKKGDNMNPLKIINYIRVNNLTKSEFCKICNIKLSILDDIVYYGNNVDFKIVEKISNVMGIGVYELYIFD